MGLYRDRLFPAFYDRVMDNEVIRAHRERQLAGLSGEVLELGVGTGLNLPHYPRGPAGVERVVTVDPNPGMNRRLARRVAQSAVPVEAHRLSGESLPFDAGRFDFAVSTLTLCSIRDVRAAVREVLRVLKPGGRFVFFEHGASADPKVRRWQRRLDWLQRLYADCTLQLDVRELLERSGFSRLDCETFELEGAPSVHAPTYRGAATK